MGGSLSCFFRREKEKRTRRRKPGGQQDAAVAAVLESSRRWEKGRSGRAMEDGLIQEAAALLLLQQQQNGGNGPGLPFDRSTSLRYPGTGMKKQQGLPRSSSTRPRSLNDAVVPPQQLVNRETKIDDLETNHFVLVHGGGFGAWCWYKTIALLEDAGFKVSAIDLTGSGIHSFDSNNITSLPQYVKPLTDFFEKLGDTEKVILIGHDFGGTCISYAMEAFPAKISKAVFLAATMLKNGQNALHIFSQQHEAANDLMHQAQIFLYANGKEQPPTAIDLEKSLLKDLLFNRSPLKDIALASVSMRPIPFAPVLEKLLLTDNHKSVRRFYIETSDDNAISLPVQQSMCESDPPEKVFQLKGSDHSPFFSKPQALHKLLVEIASIPPL
ncbi:hypothetical protein HPP92_007836 [Vanilla planifolia]|uniref:AB hydrolase-1 domain-containing protein n=1 Tax=Vanilla planifolia TaxID=51239 RepID=A0A835V9S9_VANPL|nr:hypothetical protein HPP92_007836 [Vanilla planifolia]